MVHRGKCERSYRLTESNLRLTTLTRGTNIAKIKSTDPVDPLPIESGVTKRERRHPQKSYGTRTIKHPWILKSPFTFVWDYSPSKVS